MNSDESEDGVYQTKFINLLFAAIILIPLVFKAATSTAASSSFLYTFNSDGILNSSTLMENSTSPYWWVSSGGKMIIKNGVGMTIQGYVPTGDYFQIGYMKVNPVDTDDGHYPQNTFRLVSKSIWGSAESKVSFKINALNKVDTPNRDKYSGIFLFSRYKDKDNTYYGGVRHDGLAILKKKIAGTYYTLVYEPVFGDYRNYDRNTNPNLIPQDKWIGMKLKTTNNADGSVKLELLIDKNNTNTWSSILTYTDKGIGGAPFKASGHGGIRTDYMDVEFDNFTFKNL